MNTAFLFYLNLILLVRFIFYFGERPRDILAYTIKAAIEIALLLVIFRMSLVLSLSSAALLLILNLLQSILESRLPHSIANEEVSRRFHAPAVLAGLVIYAVSIYFVFHSDNSLIFAPFIKDWVQEKTAASNIVFYTSAGSFRKVLLIFIGAFIAISEFQHLIRCFMQTLRYDLPIEGKERHDLTRLLTLGLAERAIAYALVLVFQFIGLGIIIAGKAILVAGSKKGTEYIESSFVSTFLSLALVLLLTLFIRTLI
jgi:hypothetical protein